MAGKRLALIVATDQYRDPGLRQLRAPGTDAESLAKALGDPELGEFEVDVLRNETSSTISERVESMLTSGRPEDLIVLHFSCHGLKDDSGELYLAATNTRPGLLASTAIDAALVNRLMRRSRAQRIVLFLDCCYGGAFERGMVPRAAGVVDVADQFQQQEAGLSGGRGRVVITASNAMEFAFEGTDLADAIAQQPSIFTGALVEGLTTGEADRDQDGMVSLGELYDYVFERVRQESPNQTPGKWEFGLQGDLILAKNPQRVVVPAPVPTELLELIEHPFPATRLGSVDALVRLAEGANLPIAAGARGVLERMVNDDSRSVAAAATDALAKTGIGLSVAEVDLGTVALGARAAVDVSIRGVPLATASRVEASIPALHVRRIERTIRIEADTSVAGAIHGTVTVSGPAGAARVQVIGVVADGPLQPANVPAETNVVSPASVSAAASVPAPVAPAANAPAPNPPAADASAAVAPADGQAAATTASPGPDQAPAVPATGQPVPSVAVAPSSTATPADASVPAAPATAGSPDLRAAAARSLLGIVLSTLIGGLGYLILNPNWFGRLGEFIWLNLAILAIDAILFTGAVVIAEQLVPAVRVPDGKAFGTLRGRRIPTAAVQGWVAGATIGMIGYLVALSVNGRDGELQAVPWLILSPGIGFALAERILATRRATI